METAMSNAIEVIVDNLLTEGKVLCVSIDARLHYTKKGREYSVARGIHIAIERPSRYVKVIMSVENNIAFCFNKTAKFKFKSDHDSCWRTDGLSSPLFLICSEMVKEIISKGASDLPWKQYDWFCRINQVKLLPGKIIIDRENDYEVTLELD